MAVLSDTERGLANSEWMTTNLQTCAITKVQLRAAIDAADQWREDNAASFNNALPAAARNNLTAKQKALLLVMVIQRHYGVL